MDKDLVLQILRDSYDEFYQENIYFFQDNFANFAGERNLSNHFACFLRKRFKEYDYNVDTEYGRDANAQDNLKRGEKDGGQIFPDIIVHKRGPQEKVENKNLIFIEAKLKYEDNSSDLNKIKLVLKEEGLLRYKFGVFIGFNISRMKLLFITEGITFEEEINLL